MRPARAAELCLRAPSGVQPRRCAQASRRPRAFVVILLVCPTDQHLAMRVCGDHVRSGVRVCVWVGAIECCIPIAMPPGQVVKRKSSCTHHRPFATTRHSLRCSDTRTHNQWDLCRRHRRDGELAVHVGSRTRVRGRCGGLGCLRSSAIPIRTRWRCWGHRPCSWRGSCLRTTARCAGCCPGARTICIARVRRITATTTHVAAGDGVHQRCAISRPCTSVVVVGGGV